MASAFLLGIWKGFGEILRAPFQDWSVFWILAPILILWTIFEIYFDKHKKEKLGWNTALGNGISMFWITVNLMKYLFSNSKEFFTWSKFIAVLVIFLYALFISVIAFKHYLKPKLTYMFASPTPVYFLSAVAVLWAYGSLTLSKFILIDLFLMFWFILGIELLIKRFVPEAHDKYESDSDDSSGDFDNTPSSSGKDDFSDMKF